MKISTKIRFLTIAAVCFTLGVATIYFAYHTYKLLFASEQQSRSSQVAQRVQQFTSTIDSLKRDAQTLASNPVVVDWVLSKHRQLSNGNKPLIERTFINQLQNQPQYFQLRVLNTLGHEIIRADQDAFGVHLMQESALQDKSDRDYFTNASSVVTNTVYLSKINLNEEHGAISQPEITTVRAIAPITYQLERIGYLVINIDVGPYLELARKVVEPEESFIVNEQGIFVAHSEPQNTFANQRKTQTTITSQYPEVVGLFEWPESIDAIVQKQGDVPGFAVSAHQIFYDSRNRDRYIVIYQVAPKSQIYAQILSRASEQVWVLLLVLLQGVVLAIVVGAVISKRILILKPLAQLMANGERNLNAPPFKNDEVDEVAKAFDYLLSQVVMRETQLEAKERYTRAILDTVVTGVITIDEQGVIAEVNPHAAKIFGYESKELIGSNIKTLMPKEFAMEHDQYMHEAKKGAGPRIIGKQRDLFGLRKDGTPFPIQLTVGELIYGGKTVYVGAIEDLTIRKLQEAALKHYARKLERSNEELENFAYVTAHDLQEPVRKIQAFSGLIASNDGDKLSEDGRRHLQRCQQSADKMRLLIRSLLNLARVRQVEEDMSEVYINAVCREALEELSPNIEKTKAKVEIDKELPKVYGAPILLRQLFFNLFQNSLKYVAEGVVPHIRVSRFELPGDVDLKNRDLLKTGMAVCVEDNGIGIDKDKAKSVFLPFERLHGVQEYDGAGIGLSICKKIIESGGGEIYVDTQYRSGCRFVIVFDPHLDKSSAKIDAIAGS